MCVCVCVLRAGTSDGSKSGCGPRPSSDQRGRGFTSRLFLARFPEFPKFRLFLSAEPSNGRAIGRSMQLCMQLCAGTVRQRLTLRPRSEPASWPSNAPCGPGLITSNFLQVVTLGPSSLRSAVHRRGTGVAFVGPDALHAGFVRLDAPLSCRNSSWLL